VLLRVPERPSSIVKVSSSSAPPSPSRTSGREKHTTHPLFSVTCSGSTSHSSQIHYSTGRLVYVKIYLCRRYCRASNT
jgi:hypothetical protein